MGVESALAPLRAERLERWHLTGNPLSSVDDAVAYLKNAGFCFAHRSRTFLLPSFIEAVAGTKRGVPAYGDAAGHPLYRRYVELRHHTRVKRLVLELPVIQRRHVLVVRDHVVDLARLVADPPFADRRAQESRDAALRIVSRVADRGVQSKSELREAIGRRLARRSTLDRVLLDLESRLRLVTVDYTEKEGAFYDLFARAYRSLAVRAARQDRDESLDHLVERYVISAVLSEPERVEELFRGIAGAAEVRGSVDRLAALGRITRTRTAGRAWLIAPRSS